ICRQLPSDSQSPATPLLLANPSYYKVGSGLAPYSRSPCLAHTKNPWPVNSQGFFMEGTLGPIAKSAGLFAIAS
ncbi:hypothetical protein, partial [Chitinophaga sp. sic0106]|uniref:hypothetical protein n=1 Tax=Chitinophaga sp. sic0106 TaxID=2854785 RepID=UPI001C48B948